MCKTFWWQKHQRNDKSSQGLELRHRDHNSLLYVQDEISVKQRSINWVLKLPSEFLLLLSGTTELILKHQDLGYMEAMFQFYTSSVHLPTPCVTAHGLHHDVSVLVCLISFNCLWWLFHLFESWNKANRKSFSVSVLTTTCVKLYENFPFVA